MRQNLLAAGVLLACTATAVSAQEAPGSTVGEVVVTAQRRAQSDLETPVAVTSYSGNILDDLRLFDLRDVSTFIASGNVLFSTAALDRADLEARIERRLERSLGYAVATFLRTPAELAAIVRDEPFADRDPAASLWVGLVKTAIPAEARERLLALRTALDEFEVRGREAFWLRRERSMAQLVTGARIDRALGSATTFRNVTTVRKLAQLTLERA